MAPPPKPRPAPAPDEYELRAALTADAAAIARVQVAAWRETYADLLPAEVVASFTVERRTAMWQRVLAGVSPLSTHAYVVERAGEIVGFGSCGEQRTAALAPKGFDGEINAIYVLRSAQRRGIGKALMMAMGRDLARRGVRGVSLWVIRDNKSARAFYEKLAGELLDDKQELGAGMGADEVAYGWRDVVSLSRPAPASAGFLGWLPWRRASKQDGGR